MSRMGALTLTTTIQSYGPAAAILLTEEHIAQLGGTKSPPIVVTIGGRSARLRVGRMGGDILVGLSKAARAELGVGAGDEVAAHIALDEHERTVEVPVELAAALDAEAGLREAFDALAYSTRKEAARSVAEAKQDATRERRIAKILESLRG